MFFTTTTTAKMNGKGSSAPLTPSSNTVRRPGASTALKGVTVTAPPPAPLVPSATPDTGAATTTTRMTRALDTTPKGKPSSPDSDEENVAARVFLGRDVRAYEHDRQRVRRAGEWAVRRARKAGGGDYASKPRRDGEREKGAVGMAVDGEYVLGGWRAVGEGDVGFGGDGMRAGAKTLSLSELVVTKMREKDEEAFEWVPALRRVIALDEVREMEVDEPWDVVDHPERKPPLSYAEVLRLEI